MLIRINKLELQPAWAKDDAALAVSREIRAYINPDRINGILFAPDGFDGFACIQCDDNEHWVYEQEADKLVEHINGKTDAPQPAAATSSAADDGILVHVDTMLLDSFYSKTAGQARRMWRCTSEEGYSFNIFDHVDHRNTYKLFQEAHLDVWMDNMQDGDTLDWTATPIPVYLQQNGDFYNPVKIGDIDQVDSLIPVRIPPEGSDE